MSLNLDIIFIFRLALALNGWSGGFFFGRHPAYLKSNEKNRNSISETDL